jgi:uncharacterized membrane protein
MDRKQSAAARRLPYIVRVIRARPRLFISTLVVLTIALLTPADWRLAMRLLVGWDVGLAIYLVLTWRMMWKADIHHIRSRARTQDEGSIGILVLTATAALASLGAILALLGTSNGSTRPPLFLFIGAVTIVLSWAFTHVIFALHYAHEFYSEKGSGGLDFPGGEKEPDYLDFIYFSFIIGMTSQVSDVTVSARHIRRTVAAHGIIAFFFNAALLALTVNIAASAI